MNDITRKQQNVIIRIERNLKIKFDGQTKQNAITFINNNLNESKSIEDGGIIKVINCGNF